MDKFFVFWTCA